MARSTPALCLLMLGAACWKENPLFGPDIDGPDATSDASSTSLDASSTTTAGTTTTTTDPTASSGAPGPICGDGTQDPGEQCDAGPDNGPGHPCEANCKKLLLLGNVPTFIPPGGKALAVADFDGDGLDDIAIADNTPSVAIWQNTGVGKAFEEQNAIDVGTPVVRLLAHDFSGDDKADLVAGGATGLVVFNPDGGNPLTMLPGDPESAILGDQNTDGLLDLLIADPVTNTVAWSLATGTSLLPPTGASTEGTRPNRLAVAEVTGDGKNDILVSFDFNAVEPGFIILPSGNQILGPYTSDILDSAQELVFGRIRPMPKPSVGVYDPINHHVRTFEDKGAGVFQTEHTLTLAPSLVRPLLLRLHGDALDDLLLINPAEGTLHIYSFPEGNLVQPNAVVDVMGTIYDYASGHFNADPLPDIAVLTQNGCYVLLNQFSA